MVKLLLGAVALLLRRTAGVPMSTCETQLGCISFIIGECQGGDEREVCMTWNPSPGCSKSKLEDGARPTGMSMMGMDHVVDHACSGIYGEKHTNWVPGSKICQKIEAPYMDNVGLNTQIDAIFGVQDGNNAIESPPGCGRAARSASQFSPEIACQTANYGAICVDGTQKECEIRVKVDRCPQKQTQKDTNISTNTKLQYVGCYLDGILSESMYVTSLESSNHTPEDCFTKCEKLDSYDSTCPLHVIGMSGRSECACVSCEEARNFLDRGLFWKNVLGTDGKPLQQDPCTGVSCPGDNVHTESRRQRLLRGAIGVEVLPGGGTVSSTRPCGNLQENSGTRKWRAYYAPVDETAPSKSLP